MPLPLFDIHASDHTAALQSYLQLYHPLSYAARIHHLLVTLIQRSRRTTTPTQPPSSNNMTEVLGPLGLALLQSYAVVSQNVRQFDTLFQVWQEAILSSGVALPAEALDRVAQYRKQMIEDGVAKLAAANAQLTQAKQLAETTGSAIPSETMMDYSLALFHQGEAAKAISTLLESRHSQRQSLVTGVAQSETLHAEDVNQFVLAVAMALTSIPAYGKNPTEKLLSHATPAASTGATTTAATGSKAQPQGGAMNFYKDSSKRGYDNSLLLAASTTFEALISSALLLRSSSGGTTSSATTTVDAASPIDKCGTLLEKLHDCIPATGLNRVAAVSEVVETSELLWLATLSAIGARDRSDLLNIFNRGTVRGWLDDEPLLAELVQRTLQCRFADALTLLADPDMQMRLDTNFFIGPLHSLLLSRVRDSLLCQYVTPFSSLSIPQMASAFRARPEEMERDLVRLIRSKRMAHARIDDVKKLLLVRHQDTARAAALAAVMEGGSGKAMQENAARCARWVALRRGELENDYRKELFAARES